MRSISALRTPELSRLACGLITALSICVALLGVARSGDATPKMPDSQWAYGNMLALRYNPLGLQNELFIGYKRRLYQKPQDHLLLGKAYWWAGAVSRVSPQFAQTGLFVRALPVAVLELQGIYSYVHGLSDADRLPGYYTQGTKDAVTTTASQARPAGNLIGSGWQASLQARLQAKVKNIALRSTNLFRRFDLEGVGGASPQGLFYDQTLDLVTPLRAGSTKTTSTSCTPTALSPGCSAPATPTLKSCLPTKRSSLTATPSTPFSARGSSSHGNGMERRPRADMRPGDVTR